jgi:hypothetical protein
VPKIQNYPENPKLDRELVDLWRKIDNAQRRIAELERENASLQAFATAIRNAAAMYTVSNVTVDRTYNADTAVVAELADVVGTLIADFAAL